MFPLGWPQSDNSFALNVIPAIDIRGGRCLRLIQGDYARETVYDEDPAAVARRWQDAVAQRLHIVDLDGARRGQPVNAVVIQRVLASVFIRSRWEVAYAT